MVTFGEAYRRVKQMLSSEEGAQAGSTARELLSFVSKRSTAAIMGMEHDEIPQSVLEDYLRAAERVLQGEPLAYILEHWSFYGLKLTVSPDVLIPRDDTMAVVDLALEKAGEIKKPVRVLDLCTGSGCIGLALASRLATAQVVMCDVSAKAIQIAQKNIDNCDLNAKACCCLADVLQPAPENLGKFDLIVSNPPYITEQEMLELQRSVREYEPHIALCGGRDGLDFYRAILKNYSSALMEDGYICFEFGQGQEDDVCHLLKENGYSVLELRKDYGNIVRAVIAQKKERHNVYGNG